MTRASVGILGGTFDPPHMGHLTAAEGARDAFRLEVVYFVPARQPPHKPGQPISPQEVRLQMLQLALNGNPHFRIDTMELERPGPSYTIDTIRALQRAYPDWDIHFILGADNLLQIDTWHDFRTLLTLCRFIAVYRPGYDMDQWQKKRQELGEALTRRVHLLEIPGAAISSTQIRQLVAGGHSIRYLVPDSVERFIREHNLYTNGAK